MCRNWPLYAYLSGTRKYESVRCAARNCGRGRFYSYADFPSLMHWNTVMFNPWSLFSLSNPSRHFRSFFKYCMLPVSADSEVFSTNFSIPCNTFMMIWSLWPTVRSGSEGSYRTAHSKDVIVLCFGYGSWKRAPKSGGMLPVRS